MNLACCTKRHMRSFWKRNFRCDDQGWYNIDHEIMRWFKSMVSITGQYWSIQPMLYTSILLHIKRQNIYVFIHVLSICYQFTDTTTRNLIGDSRNSSRFLNFVNRNHSKSLSVLINTKIQEINHFRTLKIGPHVVSRTEKNMIKYSYHPARIFEGRRPE